MKTIETETTILDNGNIILDLKLSPGKYKTIIFIDEANDGEKGLDDLNVFELNCFPQDCKFSRKDLYDDEY